MRAEHKNLKLKVSCFAGLLGWESEAAERAPQKAKAKSK
jgi:hypothetical protein